jgi:molybdopterin molybdotransferase
MSDTPAHELDAQEALAVLRCELAPVLQHQQVSLAGSSGRILATDIVAGLDLPAFANSAMDGYAVRAADCRAHDRLRVTGAAFAGHVYTSPLRAGTAVRIMTGAPLPPEADAIAPQEDAHREGDLVWFAAAVTPGQFVRPRGEHVAATDVVVAKGTTLRAPEIGLATAVGATQVEVYRPLRVGIASTGDELVDPPGPLGATGSYDGNRPLIEFTCRAAGFCVFDLGICPDRADEFAHLIDRARAALVDALLVIGGSALGDADVVRQAETVRFLPVNIRPGRGFTFGHFSGAAGRLALIGLPGNAVSAFVMFHLIVLPALHHLAGGIAKVPEHLPVPLAVDVACRSGCVDYRRGRLESDPAGRLAVRPLDRQGAGMLRTIVEADVLVAAGPKPLYRAGELIPVVPLASLPR